MLHSLILLEVLSIAPLQASTARLRSKQSQQEQTMSIEMQSTARMFDMAQRQAIRLQKRLKSRGMGYVSVAKIYTALQHRRRLLTRTLELNFLGSDAAALAQVTATPAQHPLWIEPTISTGNLSFALSQQQIAQELSENVLAHVPAPVDAQVLAFVAGDVLRVETDAIAKEGYVYDAQQLASGIIRELEGDEAHAYFTLEMRAGRIENRTGSDLGPLELLVTGRSNFKGSGNGRISNVRKGLNERMRNIIVPPRETFSFNDAIGPMRAGEGWMEALGIFNGDQLRPVRGGGICQVATTVYRAAVNYGFPIVERKNHSLYVPYYEAYGVGIDATVFRGSQDLKFVNDTGSPLLVQAYTDGFEAYVSIYGAPDGRTVALKGPFFASSPLPQELRDAPLRKSEIAWVQEISYANGDTHSNVIRSRYKSIPQSLPQKFAVAAGAL